MEGRRGEGVDSQAKEARSSTIRGYGGHLHTHCLLTFPSSCLGDASAHTWALVVLPLRGTSGVVAMCGLLRLRLVRLCPTTV